MLRLLAHYPPAAPTRLLAKLRAFNACDYLQTIAAPQQRGAAAGDPQEAADALRRMLAAG